MPVQNLESIYQESYLIIPRSIYMDKELSLEAMVLYGFLLDRTKLSQKNKLIDEQGIFVYCTIEEAAAVLRKSPRKTIQVFHELVQHKRIHRVHQGMNRANKYYIRLPSEVQNLHNVQDLHDRECSDCTQDVQDFHFKECTVCTQEVQNLQTSNNKPNHNYISHNENSKSSPLLPESDQSLLLKAKLDIRYFSRKAAGESEEQLEKEAYEHYLSMKKAPLTAVPAEP